MDNIGDYLYVLIFVGIFIFNLLKKIRKAAPATQPAKPVAKPRPAVFDPEEDRPRHDVNFPEPPRVPKPRVITIEQQATVAPKPKPKPAVVPVVTEAVAEEEQVIDLDFADTAELRKGIVYSEIFNRKY